MTRLLTFFLLALPTAAFAQAPGFVPVQGFLTTADGDPIDGTVSVRFALYDSSSDPTPVFSETQDIRVEGGFFDAYIGDVESLDLALFDQGGAAYLGIQVVGDAEMVPRVPLGTVPFAAYAERAGDARTVGGFSPEALAVPSGAILMFSGATCPDGWTPYAAARGRAIVGSTGTGVEETVGTPLGNRENRSHSHTVDPPSTATNAAGNHTHIADPPRATTSRGNLFTVRLTTGSGPSAGDYRHTHTIDISPFYVERAGEHSHTVDVPSVTSTTARTGDVMPYIQLLLCQKM